MLPLLVAINQYFTPFERILLQLLNQKYSKFWKLEERGREQEACPLLSSCTMHSEVSVEARTPVTPGTVSSH